MATHRIPIHAGLDPGGAAGNVFWKPSITDDANDRFREWVLAFKDTGTRIGASGMFTVPKNWVNTNGSKIIIIWKCVPTSGDAVFDFDYKAIAIGESLDPSSDDESLSVTDTAAGTARLANEAQLALDESKLAVDDIVYFSLFRDTSDAADTLTGAEAHVVAVYFEYLDV